MSIGTRRVVALSVLALAPCTGARGPGPSRRHSPGGAGRAGAARHLRPGAAAQLGHGQRRARRAAAGLPRPRRLEAGARPRGAGGRLGHAGGRVLRPLGRLRRSRPGLAHPLLLVGSRLGRRRPRERLGAADVVRDGLHGGRRVAGPVDRRPRTPAGPDRGRGRGRRRGDPRRGRVLPPGPLAGPRLRRRPQPERPGRVPRDPAGAEAAQVLPGREAVHPGPRLLVRAGLQRPDGQRAPRVRAACWTPGSPTTAGRFSTRPTTSPPCCARARTSSPPSWDRATTTTRRGRGTGDGTRPSGGRPRGCGSTFASPTRTGPSRWWRPTARGRSRAPARPGTTATTWARPTTRGARSRGGTSPASTTRPGPRPGS